MKKNKEEVGPLPLATEGEPLFPLQPTWIWNEHYWPASRAINKKKKIGVDPLPLAAERDPLLPLQLILTLITLPDLLPKIKIWKQSYNKVC